MVCKNYISIKVFKNVSKTPTICEGGGPRVPELPPEGIPPSSSLFQKVQTLVNV